MFSPPRSRTGHVAAPGSHRQIGQLLPDVPHEVRRLPDRRHPRGEHDGLLARSIEVGRGVVDPAFGADGRAALLHQVEDGVATLDDPRVLWHDQRTVVLLLGIADEVVVAG